MFDNFVSDLLVNFVTETEIGFIFDLGVMLEVEGEFGFIGVIERLGLSFSIGGLTCDISGVFVDGWLAAVVVTVVEGLETEYTELNLFGGAKGFAGDDMANWRFNSAFCKVSCLTNSF